MPPLVVTHAAEPRAVVAEFLYLGIPARSLAGLPRRAFSEADVHLAPPLLDPLVDARVTEPLLTPAAAAIARAGRGESWLAQSRRAQLSLLAWFLLAEDRQRRLVVREVAPLMHQLSLVEHVLESPDLQRLLIGDEVGLGKTVEAGLIAQRLLAARPDLRVLYLSPARLVRNVVTEFRRLGIDARKWVASDSDARVESDRVVIASIQKSVRESNAAILNEAGPWDLLIVDECHHLSDWDPGGGSPNASYRLVRDLLQNQRPDAGHLLLLSGTPHQGHQARFENILSLLRRDGEALENVAGRVIFRTKESIQDWYGRPLFPRRDVRRPIVVQLGGPWAQWYDQVAALYDGASSSGSATGRRAGGWAKGQALQWVASSVEAGLGFLVRLAIRRLRWDASHPALEVALAELRPYRGGSVDEPLAALYERIRRQIGVQEDEEDAEEVDEAEEGYWMPDPALLGDLLARGAELKRGRADAEKWRAMTALLESAESEKLVLFCQPVETVAVVAREIQAMFGERPAVILGGQSDAERDEEVARFRDQRGPRFLVSSRAGGEGINLQVARRVLHLDVPWNPMDLEQRVGRVHRFGSRQTILVDTIVVAGTREADAYRIARDKLRLIVGQLDPERFESLFSRVMSLVPPEELAEAFGAHAPWPAGGETENQIASIVHAGYTRWSDFSTRYAEGAAQITSLDPGSADWADVRDFVRRACGGTDGPPAMKPVFSIENDEVVARDAEVSTVRVASGLFVCDETDGLPATDGDRVALPRLGTGDAVILSELRTHLKERPENQIASVRLASGDLPGTQGCKTAVVMFFVLQPLEMTIGMAEERELRLRGFLINDVGELTEIAGDEFGRLVRRLCSAERQATPASPLLAPDLAGREAGLVEQLRQDHARQRQEQYEGTGTPPLVAIWPAGCFVVALTGRSNSGERGAADPRE